MAISVIGQDPGSLAANHIKDIINAMTEAQKSQIDLKSKIMLSKIQQQQDLQTNKEKLAQGVQSNIDQKNANLNWMNSLSQDNNAYGSIGGVANSQTPNQMGDAMTMGQPTPAAPPGPSTPQMSMADQSQQPANNAASQMSMAPVAPATSPIGRPLPPPEGPVIMSPSGPVRNPNINSPDNISYNGIYNKWKSGQPLSAQESDLVRNKFSNGPDGKPLAQISNKEQETPGIVNPASNRVQTALRNYEKVTGAPEGSYWLNPSTGDAEVSPIWKSKMEAQARYNVEAPDRYGKMAEQDLMHVFSMRSGALGVQDAKINQAMHIKQLFDQSYDPKTGVYNLKAPQFAEATQGLAELVSNSNQTSEGQRQEIKQRTAKGDFDGALTYFLGTPKNATTQDIAKMYIDAVDRQGLQHNL